jgi:nitrogen fixation protein
MMAMIDLQSWSESHIDLAESLITVETGTAAGAGVLLGGGWQQ